MKISSDSEKFIINSCRELFFKWYGASEVREASKRKVPRYKKDGTRHKVDGVEYQCASCGDYYKSGDIELDHKHEVGRGETIEEKLEILLDVENLQVLCIGCHKDKTREYMFERMVGET